MFNTGTCGDNRWPRWAQRAGLRGYTQRDFFLTSYLQSSNTVIFRNLSGTKSCNGTRYSLSVQLRSHQVGRGDNRATLNPIEVTKKSSYFHEKKEIMTQNSIGGFFTNTKPSGFFSLSSVSAATRVWHMLWSLPRERALYKHIHMHVNFMHFFITCRVLNEVISLIAWYNHKLIIWNID